MSEAETPATGQGALEAHAPIRPIAASRAATWRRRAFTTIAAAVIAPLVFAIGWNAAIWLGAPPLPHPIAGEYVAAKSKPPRLPVRSDAYKFKRVQAGTSNDPVTWDSCRAIPYVTYGTPPASGQRLVETAVAQVSAATGIAFINEGATTESPHRDRADYQPGRYGNRWAPLLVAWTDPKVVPELAGAVVGLGGPGWEYDPETGRQVYVTGLLFLDKPQMANIIESGKRNSAALDVVLHELGHVMGLTHVNGQVMAPYVGSTSRGLQIGDKTGLARLGAGRCAPAL